MLATVVAVSVVSTCNAAGTRGRSVADSPGVHDGKTHSCIHDHVVGSMPAPQHAQQTYHGEGSGGVVHPLGGRALSASHCGTEFCPIRVTWEFFSVTAGASLPQASIDFLRDVIMPAAVARLQDMYLVKPLATNLGISRSCNSFCSSGARQGKCVAYTTPATCSLGDGATPVTIPSTYYGEQVEGCGPTTTLPAATGVPNSDFHIFVRAEATSNCVSGSTLAYAGACQRDADSDRPTVGVVNFCPLQISLAAGDERGQVYTAIHELHHAMGFSSGSWNLFRDQPNGGTPRTPRNPVIPNTVAASYVERVLQDTSAGTCTPFPSGSAGAGQAIVQVQTPDVNTVAYFGERGIAQCTTAASKLQNGGCVARMVTSEATARARDFFGCPTLPGVELENQRTSSACAVVGSHLEQRVFLQNFMAPVTSHHSIISPVEMGIMQDSGWYIANYSAADALGGEWGVGQGCTFATDKCLGLPKSAPVNVATAGDRPHFCTDYVNVNDNQGCTVDRRAVGACSGVAGQTVPTEFSYFTDPSVGSISPIQTDYCPYIKAFSNRICSDTSENTATAAEFGRVYGADSLCATSTLLKAGRTTPSHVGVGCFTTACITAPLTPSELTVIAGTDGLPPPTPSSPWLLLGAVDPDTSSLVHYAACINGSASMNPAPGVFNGEFTCVDPAVFCNASTSSASVSLPSPSPSPSVLPSPSPTTGAGGAGDSSAEDGFLGTGVDAQYIYYGAGGLAALIALACLWQCCCKSSKAPEAATQGGRYQPGQNIQMTVQPRTR